MPVKGFTSVTIKKEDLEEILSLGQWLIGDVGVKVDPPASLRAMIRRLQQIREEEDGASVKD